jgi:hypothetical protein
MIYLRRKLDRRLAEVLDQYSPILEGVEVEELKSDVKQKQNGYKNRENHNDLQRKKRF